MWGWEAADPPELAGAKTWSPTRVGPPPSAAKKRRGGTGKGLVEHSGQGQRGFEGIRGLVDGGGSLSWGRDLRGVSEEEGDGGCIC